MGKLDEAMLSGWSSSKEWGQIRDEWKDWHNLVRSGVLYRLSPEEIGRQGGQNSNTTFSRTTSQVLTNVNDSEASVSLRQPSVELETPQHQLFLVDVGYSTESNVNFDYYQTPAWYSKRITDALFMIEELSRLMGKNNPRFLDALYHHLQKLEQRVRQNYLDQECLTDA